MKKLVESLVKSIIKEVNKDYTIYFDLDDTLSNYTKNLRTSIYTDPETGEKRPFTPKDTANDFDYWVRAELLPGAKGMVNFAQQNFKTVKILSAVPALSKAKQEETGETYYKAPIEGKTKWLADNGFSLPAIWTNSGTAKKVYATPMTVLVDDKEENIKAFEKAGGKGILFTNAQDVIQKLKDILNPEINISSPSPEPSIQELFEPSSNSYEYDQVTSLDYTFMSDYGRTYIVGITPESEGRISIDFGIEDEYGDISFPETNERDVFKIIATVSNIVKDYLSKHPDIEIISWSSVAKKGEKKIGDTQRDKLYKLVAQRQGNLKPEDIVRKDNEYWAYLKGYNPMFEDVSYSDLFDIEDYADEKLDPIDIKIPDHFVDRVNDKRNKPSIKPEELYNFFDKLSDDKDDLITMLNKGEEVVATDSQSKINIPLTKDKNSQLKSKVKTVAKTIMRKDNFQTTSPKLVFEKDFFEPIEDKQSELNISSEPTRVDYYKDHIQNVVPSDFKVEKQKDKIVVTPTSRQKQNLENNPEFKELLVSLTMHMMDHINIEPLPDLIFIEDDVQNAKDMLGRTAYYNHNDKTITLYTYGRHPKDILRSYAHEMIHHKQNLEGRLKNKINTQNINEDDYLKELEAEAYKYGNGLLFREWENSL